MAHKILFDMCHLFLLFEGLTIAHYYCSNAVQSILRYIPICFTYKFTYTNYTKYYFSMIFARSTYM